MKETFVSFDLYAGRSTVECTEYGSTLFSYNFRKILLWIQGLYSICSVT